MVKGKIYMYIYRTPCSFPFVSLYSACVSRCRMAVPLRVSRCCDFSALARSFSAAPLTPTALSALRVVAALSAGAAAAAAAAGAAAAAADEGCAVLLVSVTLGRKPPQSSGLSEDAEEEEEAAAAAFAPADTRAAARGCFACFFGGG